MVILYSTGCPKCKVLKMKLQQKKVEFEEKTDVEEMLALGMTAAPVLSVDGILYQFSDAIKYLNKL